MKIRDILPRRKNYMGYLDYGPKVVKPRRKIEVKQLGFKKFVYVRREK